MVSEAVVMLACGSSALAICGIGWQVGTLGGLRCMAHVVLVWALMGLLGMVVAWSSAAAVCRALAVRGMGMLFVALALGGVDSVASAVGAAIVAAAPALLNEASASAAANVAGASSSSVLHGVRGSFLSTALKLRGGCSRGSDVPGVGTGIVTLGGVCCMVHVVLV